MSENACRPCSHCGSTDWTQADSDATYFYHYCGRTGRREVRTHEANQAAFYARLDAENKAIESADPRGKNCCDCDQPATRPWILIGGATEYYCDEHHPGVRNTIRLSDWSPPVPRTR
jgi:hypothetical protein